MEQVEQNLPYIIIPFSEEIHRLGTHKFSYEPPRKPSCLHRGVLEEKSKRDTTEDQSGQTNKAQISASRGEASGVGAGERGEGCTPQNLSMCRLGCQGALRNGEDALV